MSDDDMGVEYPDFVQIKGSPSSSPKSIPSRENSVILEARDVTTVHHQQKIGEQIDLAVQTMITILSCWQNDELLFKLKYWHSIISYSAITELGGTPVYVMPLQNQEMDHSPYNSPPHREFIFSLIQYLQKYFLFRNYVNDEDPHGNFKHGVSHPDLWRTRREVQVRFTFTTF